LRRRFSIFAILLLAALTVSADRLAAQVYWSSIAAACTPASDAIQNDRYAATAEGGVAPSPGSIDPIVLICAVPPKLGAEPPRLLSMTYVDSTGVGSTASVVAQLIRVSRSSGARGVVTTVSSNDVNRTTLAYRKSEAFAQLNFDSFFYFVRIAIDRSAAIEDVRSLGVALESQPPIAAFGPPLSYARVGATTGAATFPEPLTVTLREPSQSDTTVIVESGNADALTTSNVTIPAGATSAPALVSAIAQSADVTVTARLGSQAVRTHVRVLGAAEEPSAAALSPSNVPILAGGSATFTVTLDTPALSVTEVALALNPPNAGMLPTLVTIMGGQLKAVFTYTDTSTLNATITATFGANTSSATITVSP